MCDLIIAIDGFSGTGKSSTAKMVAKYFKFKYLDSGAMYRSVALACINKKVNILDEQKVQYVAKSINISFDNQNNVFLDNEIVTDEIRTMEVNNAVSQVSKYKGVRTAMVEQQRRLSVNSGVVMDGRDIGTVVFPNADIKVFMTASPQVRAERRLKELANKGIKENLVDIKRNLLERDEKDSNRKESPLKKAEGAVEIDTSNISFDDQVSQIISLVERKSNEG